MMYSKGIMWLDDCRIPFLQGDVFDIRQYNDYHDTFSSYEDRGSAEGKYEVNEPNQQGRFTPNLLVCDDMLNDGSISKKTTPKITQVGIGRGVIGNHDGRKTLTKAKEDMKMLRSVGDGGTNSRYYDLDLWFDKMIEKL